MTLGALTASLAACCKLGLGPDGVRDAAADDWVQVSERTRCEAMQDAYCLGRYGFTIHRDGTFLAGPSADGHEVEGRITAAELHQLEALMGPFSPRGLRAQPVCEPGGPPGILDQIDVMFRGDLIVRTYDLGGSVGQLCYRGDKHDIGRLYRHLQSLMARYYPVPFPKS